MPHAAISAFSDVRLNFDRDEVLVNGNSDPDFGATSIIVAVIAEDDENKRLQGAVVGEPAGTVISGDWEVRLRQLNVPREADLFDDDDPVLVVGLATSTSGVQFLWGGVSSMTGPEIAAITQIVHKTSP